MAFAAPLIDSVDQAYTAPSAWQISLSDNCACSISAELSRTGM
jgi:hypothetical protein